MNWRSGQPIGIGYYLCAIIGYSQPSELFWDGSGWFCSIEYESDESIDNNDVIYYMNLSDIPMPEGW